MEVATGNKEVARSQNSGSRRPFGRRYQIVLVLVLVLDLERGADLQRFVLMDPADIVTLCPVSFYQTSSTKNPRETRPNAVQRPLNPTRSRRGQGRSETARFFLGRPSR